MWITKWGPLLGLLFLIGISFYTGYEYKSFLVNKAELKKATEAFNHYQKNGREYIQTEDILKEEYDDKVNKIESDTTPECNAIAPECLSSAF